MSWIRTENDELINLDHAERLLVVPLENEDGGAELYALVADFASNEEYDYIMTGRREDCESKFSYLAARLPMVKGL